MDLLTGKAITSLIRGVGAATHANGRRFVINCYTVEK
jgi:hypothetical protein